MIFGAPLFGKAGFTPMEFISASTAVEATGTTYSITFSPPASIQNDDTLIAFIALGPTANDLASIPSGFTEVATVISGTFNERVAICIKTAENESGDYTFTETGSSGTFSGAMLCYRSARGVVNTVGDFNETPLDSITPTKRGNLLAVLLNPNGDPLTVPAEMTLRASGYELEILDENPNGTGATGTRSFGEETFEGFLIQIT